MCVNFYLENIGIAGVYAQMQIQMSSSLVGSMGRVGKEDSNMIQIWVGKNNFTQPLIRWPSNGTSYTTL